MIAASPRVGLTLAAIAARGAMHGPTGQVEHGLVVGVQDRQHQRSPTIDDIDRPNHVASEDGNIGEQGQQLGFIVADSPR